MVASSADSYLPLKGSRRYPRPGSQVLGRSGGHEWCEVTVKVRRKTPLPEPVPSQAMSYDELASKYGAEAGDLDTVEKVLTTFGLTVTSKSTATRAVQVAGPVDAMEKAFGVQLFRVKHDKWLYRGRVGDIHIPHSLDGIVTGVFGLDSRPMIKHRKLMELQAAEALPPAKTRSWYLPQELADAYRFPAGDGAGQTIGILEFGGEYLPRDLQLFVQLSGLPATPSVAVKNVHVLPPQQRNDPDAIGETMLDVEVIAGVCPKADIVVYFSQWTEKGWVDILDAAIADNATLSVLSVSYGLAEGQDIWTQQAIDEINATLKELAAVGITVCAASGDDGSDDQVADGQAHVSFPASSPYVLSVGGTTLMRTTGSEVVWFEGDGLRRDQGGSTGGGVSAMNPRPSWQTANIPSVNPHAPAGRIVPDVAANAAGGTGYFMVAQNTPQVSGGTSAATPLWAALIARLRQAGKPVGFLTPLLYQANPNTNGQPLGAVSCKDITVGSNAAGTAAGYSAGVGFDAVTGWGSPDGATLLAKLPLASNTLAKRPGQHVERISVTRAMKNARHLQRLAPDLLPREEPTQGLLSLVPPSVLKHLHRIRTRGDVDALPETRFKARIAELFDLDLLPSTGVTLRDPLFNGTLYFANITFTAQDTGQAIAVPNADMLTAIAYATLARTPICEYASQFGNNSMSVSPNVLQLAVTLPSNQYNDSQLQGWVNTIANTNGLGSNDCVVVLNPVGMLNTDALASNGVGGYHSKADLPYMFINLFGTGLTLSDAAGSYAQVLSHEMAETAVDPQANLVNPEVCDGCGPNCQTVYLNYFDDNNNFIVSTQGAAPAGYAYYINGIVSPASATVCPAPAGSCSYSPPFPTSTNAVMAWKGVDGDQGIWFSTFDGDRWSPQQNIAGVGTSVGPALAEFDGGTLMAWKGVENDQGIWFSVYDGNGWAPQQNIAGVGTSVGPALATFNGKVVMAWKGVDGDQGIWFSVYDGNGWAPQQNIGGVGTSVGPALAAFNGNVVMAWKGVGGDQGIWYSTFDGNGWSPQQNIAGVGTSFRPALAVFEGRLYMVWKGVQGDQGIWFSSFDGNGWAPQQNIAGVGTSVGPSLVSLGDALLMAWKGVQGDQGIWFTTFDGNGWAPQQNVNNVGTSVGPALALTQPPFMAWKGVEGDQGIWFTSFYGNAWLPQRNVGGVGTDIGPTLALFDGKIHMAWKGIAGDQRLWFSSYDGNGWAPQQNIPGVGSSVGPSLTNFGGRLFMVWKGVEGDQGIWFATYDGLGWSGQQNVPGVGTNERPSVVAYQGKVLMAWKGVDGDQSLWYTTYDGNGWAPQQQIPGVASSVGPVLTVYQGKVMAAWKGMDDDQGIWFATFDGSGWSGQQNVPGVGTSFGPSLTVYAGKVFMAWKGVVDDQGVWFSTYDGFNWSPQQNIAGIGSSVGPALVNVC
ncbi:MULTISPECIES: S8 family serine peptidase [Burkholderia cepacia complex]|nr:MULTISPECIES: S8 family serine peptidase [Burkholderia cepacia complex]